MGGEDIHANFLALSPTPVSLGSLHWPCGKPLETSSPPECATPASRKGGVSPDGRKFLAGGEDTDDTDDADEGDSTPTPVSLETSDFSARATAVSSRP